MNIILFKFFYDIVLNVQYIPQKSFYFTNVKYIQLNYIYHIQISIIIYKEIFYSIYLQKITQKYLNDI